MRRASSKKRLPAAHVVYVHVGIKQKVHGHRPPRLSTNPQPACSPAKGMDVLWRGREPHREPAAAPFGLSGSQTRCSQDPSSCSPARRGSAIPASFLGRWHARGHQCALHAVAPIFGALRCKCMMRQTGAGRKGSLRQQESRGCEGGPPARKPTRGQREDPGGKKSPAARGRGMRGRASAARRRRARGLRRPRWPDMRSATIGQMGNAQRRPPGICPAGAENSPTGRNPRPAAPSSRYFCTGAASSTRLSKSRGSSTVHS